MSIMNDFQGKPLALGDQVAFPRPNYRGLTLGTVVAFTPKKIRLEYVNTWNYGKPGHTEYFLTNPCDVAKLEKSAQAPVVYDPNDFCSKFIGNIPHKKEAEGNCCEYCGQAIKVDGVLA
jgi:hypothetical protein